jgi:hypothetical protein
MEAAPRVNLVSTGKKNALTHIIFMIAFDHSKSFQKAALKALKLNQ